MHSDTRAPGAVSDVDSICDGTTDSALRSSLVVWLSDREHPDDAGGSDDPCFRFPTDRADAVVGQYLLVVPRPWVSERLGVQFGCRQRVDTRLTADPSVLSVSTLYLARLGFSLSNLIALLQFNLNQILQTDLEDQGTFTQPSSKRDVLSTKDGDQTNDRLNYRFSNDLIFPQSIEDSPCPRRSSVQPETLVAAVAFRSRYQQEVGIRSSGDAERAFAHSTVSRPVPLSSVLAIFI